MRSTNLAKRTGAALCLTVILILEFGTFAQSNPASPAVAYSLLEGSQLLDDCPICDHLPIAIPISGTFRLRLKEANPLFGTYDLLDIAFHTANTNGLQYVVSGSGTYEYGGPAGQIQNAFLTVNVDSGSQTTLCYCTNSPGTVDTKWPDLQINVEQTNGTLARVFHLKILAAPVPQFTAITPDPRSGNVALQWEANGNAVQLERSENAAGPYTPLAPITTEGSFTDVGALTNRTQYFYRLRQM
jgi:hypothetical protein